MPIRKPGIIHIAIDSSILRQDRGLSKKDMAFLRELGKLKLVKLHIPWFVYKECTTHNVDEIVKELSAALNHLSKLPQKGLHIKDEMHYRSIRKDIEKLKGQVQKSVESVWKEFIADTDSVLYPFDSKISVNVFDSYFDGGAPFRSLKARDDIPDAFIFETLKQIANINKLHFICGDNRLRDTVSGIPNVFGYKSFDDFFKVKEFEPAKKYYDNHGNTELKRLEFLSLVPSISTFLEEAIERWGWFDYYVDYPYSNDEFVTITSLYDITVSISNDNVKLVAGEFYLDVIIRGKASLEYFVNKSDVPWDEEYRMSLSDCNDYVFQAEEEDIDITIRHTLILPENYLQEEMDIAFQSGDVADEIEFDHLKETANSYKRRRSDI